MKSLSKHTIFFLSLIIIMAMIATGCNTNDTSDDTGDSSEDKTSEETKNEEITVDSEMGEVTIPANPENILAPFHEDTLLTLGVTPVAKWAIDTSVQEHLEDQLADIPTIEWTMPLEQVLSYEPDLIILENSLDSYEGTYEDYQKIAPTFVMDEETVSDWKKQIDVFGELLGKEDEADQAMSDYDDTVEEAKESISDAIGEDSVAAIWVVGGKYFVFEKDRHSAEVLYDELGVTVPSFIDDLGEASPQWEALSLEKLSELDADHVILLADDNEEGIKNLETSNVWAKVPAVENDNVHIINEADAWTNQGKIAATKTIDSISDIFVK